MNLAHMFEIQRKLDQHIIEKKGLEGQDLLPQKILALQVELGELANEWRGFKFWSEYQEPRNRNVKCHACDGVGKFYLSDSDIGIEPCGYCDGTGIQEKNPLLEEYVDCLHFILSIGLDCKFNDGKFYTSHKKTTLEQFLRLFEKVGDFSAFPTKGNYECIFNYFLGLGEMLGFTWDEVEKAYLEKNRVNYQRQESGY